VLRDRCHISMNAARRVLGSFCATGPDPAPVSSAASDPLVEALVERCGKLTEAEEAALHGAWREIERDPQLRGRVHEGFRLAYRVSPEAVPTAATRAEFAWLGAQHRPANEMLQAAHDVRFGPTIAAIRAHAVAVAARDALATDLADLMSGPWRAAVAPEPRPPAIEETAAGPLTG
jgi:hypothetical protein